MATGTILSPTQLAELDLAVGWPAADVPQAVAIEINQDGGEGLQAVNPTDPRGGSFGEFQINGVHGPGGEATPAWIAEIEDPFANSEEALTLFQSDSPQWTDWTNDPSLSPAQTSLGQGELALNAAENALRNNPLPQGSPPKSLGQADQQWKTWLQNAGIPLTFAPSATAPSPTGTAAATTNAQTDSIASKAIGDVLGATGVGSLLLEVAFVALGGGLVIVGGYLMTGRKAPSLPMPVPV